MSSLYAFDEKGRPYRTVVYDAMVGDFEHSFGGKPYHDGIIPNGKDQPLQLMYLFDTTDPLFPYAPRDFRFLPLFSAIRFEGTAVQYRVLSDSAIRIIGMDDRPFNPATWYDDYPAAYPRLDVSLREVVQFEWDNGEPVPIVPTDIPGLIEFDEVLQDRWEVFGERPQQCEPSPNQLAQLEAGLDYLFDVHCRNPDCPETEMNFFAQFGGEWLADEGVSIYGGCEELNPINFVAWICPSCFEIRTGFTR